MTQSTSDDSVPFGVDLDGTLLVTDTLYEGIVLLLPKRGLITWEIPNRI